MPKTVAFIYGFGEGSWHGQRIEPHLQKLGMRLIQDPHKADIVIAHSGGAMFAPFAHHNQQTLFINPAYWPRKRLPVKLACKIVADIRLNLLAHPGFFIIKTFWNILYGLNFVRTFQLLQAYKSYNLIDALHGHQAVIIRNEHDAWLSPEIKDFIADNPQVTVAHLPGEHDDCWLRPERYVNLLQSET